MSLLESMPQSKYRELTKKNDWVPKVVTMLKLSENFDNNGEKLLSYLHKKGYTWPKLNDLLSNCKSVSNTEQLMLSTVSSNPTLKVAILVANSIYDNWSHLVTPVSDCKEIGKILKTMGFIVIFLYNVTSDQFKKSISELCSAIPPKSYALFYFAGHGFELCGTKYMLGIETPSENYTIENGVSENYIIRHGFRNEPDLFILLLDMCRKQPDQKTNPDIYLNIPPLEEYKNSCNLIIGYATSPYMAAIEKVCCKSKSISQVQHDSCEINYFSKSLLTDSTYMQNHSIGYQAAHKLKYSNQEKGLSLYVQHLKKHLNRKEDFVRILEMVHRDFAKEQSEDTPSQRPQKLDNVSKQFYLCIEASGKKIIIIYIIYDD